MRSLIKSILVENDFNSDFFKPKGLERRRIEKEKRDKVLFKKKKKDYDNIIQGLHDIKKLYNNGVNDSSVLTNYFFEIFSEAKLKDFSEGNELIFFVNQFNHTIAAYQCRTNEFVLTAILLDEFNKYPVFGYFNINKTKEFIKKMITKYLNLKVSELL
jgi:hypothetical protein